MPCVGLPQITNLSKWLTLAVHGYLRRAGDFFVFYFGFLPLPPHNHPSSRLWRADAVDSLSRTFPFIYALNQGGQLCPLVSSSQPHLSFSLVFLNFLDSLRWVVCSPEGTGSPTLQGVNLADLVHDSQTVVCSD